MRWTRWIRVQVGVLVTVLVAWAMTSLSFAQTGAVGLSVPGDELAGLTMTVEEALRDADTIILGLEKNPNPLDRESSEQFREASRLANYVIGRDPLNVTAGYQLGRLALLSGQPREAMARIEQYVGTPDNPGPGRSDWYAHKLLGDIRLVSYPQLALPEFEYAVQLAPNEPDAAIGLAKAHLKLNHAPEAAERARGAIRNDREGDPDYRVVLAEALLLDKQYEEADKTAREAVELGEQKVRAKPGDVVLLNKAKDYYSLRVKCLEQLLTLHGDEPDYVLEYVRVWQDRADLDRLIDYHAALLALERARKSESLTPTPELLLEEARLNRIVGRNDEAIALLERLVDEHPDFAPAQEMLNALQPVSAPSPSDAPPSTSASR